MFSVIVTELIALATCAQILHLYMSNTRNHVNL